MNNYAKQYQIYYEGLKKNGNVSAIYKKIGYEDNIPTYRNSIRINKKNNKSNNFLGNLIIVQLVGTMMLFLFVFGAKYSGDEDIFKYYSKLKQEVEKEYIYTNAEVDGEEAKFDDIKAKIENSIQWIKGIFTQDEIIY